MKQRPQPTSGRPAQPVSPSGFIANASDASTPCATGGRPLKGRAFLGDFESPRRRRSASCFGNCFFRRSSFAFWRGVSDNCDFIRLSKQGQFRRRFSLNEDVGSLGQMRRFSESADRHLANVPKAQSSTSPTICPNARSGEAPPNLLRMGAKEGQA